jgi:hypothetical protein
MKKVLAITETALFAVLLAAAYYLITPALADWAAAFDHAGFLSDSGHLYFALLIINVIAAVEIAFFYRLRKLGAENLGLRKSFTYSDAGFIPLTAGIALGVYWLVIRLSDRLLPFGTIYIPAPQTPADWIVIILLIAVSAVGAELFLRAFVFNLLHTKRGIPRSATVFYSVVLCFAVVAFSPANGLGLAAASVPFMVYYVLRRNFRGSVIAQGLFLVGVVLIALLGGFSR